MKNYGQNNNYQTSREYYNQVLKKENKNLNSSESKLDYLDEKLDKMLTVVYRIFDPMFRDVEAPSSYKNEFIKDAVDREFDEEVAKRIPNWLQIVIDFFVRIYQLIFPVHLIEAIFQRFSKINLLKRLNSHSFVKSPHNFFRINSSP